MSDDQGPTHYARLVASEGVDAANRWKDDVLSSMLAAVERDLARVQGDLRTLRRKRAEDLKTRDALAADLRRHRAEHYVPDPPPGEGGEEK